MLTRRTFLVPGVVGTIAAAGALARLGDKQNIQAQTSGPPSPTGPTDHPGAFAAYEPPRRSVEARDFAVPETPQASRRPW